MKVIWAGIFIVIIGCVYMIRESGYNPKPILVMKPSIYESNNIVGLSLAKRFYIEAKENPHFIIYCDLNKCNEHIEIWQSFLSESIKNKLEVRQYFNYLKYSSSDNLNNYIKKIKDSVATGNYTLHILPKNMRDAINIEGRPEIIEFYMTHFYLSRVEEEESKPCKDLKDMADVDCLRLGFSRRHYRKKFESKDNHIGMEKISNNKYIMYIN